MICLVCMPKDQGLKAYILGKSQVPMLQLVCSIALQQAESSSNQKFLSSKLKGKLTSGNVNLVMILHKFSSEKLDLANGTISGAHSKQTENQNNLNSNR